MSDLAVVLGYEAIASAVARTLADGDAISVIEGPPGVGKSTLATDIGELWERGGGRTLVAEGDQLQSHAPFFALNRTIAPLVPAWKAAGSDVAGVSKAAERHAGTAGIITNTVRAALRARPSRQRARKLYLGDAEQAILFELERLAGKRPLLLIADDLHWWDRDSLELLGRFRARRMKDAFAFLADMRVIAVQTTAPYQETANPTERDALLATAATEAQQLGRVPRDAFTDVLVALGAPEDRAAPIADDLYDVTGGHLALADRCAKRLRDPERDLRPGATEKDEFVDGLLTDRINALGAAGRNALAILQIAAVFGLTFHRDELVCAFDGSPEDVWRLLRMCRDEDLLKLSQDVGRFVHDLFRQHFLTRGHLDTPTIHETVGDCLRQLRPGAYEQRCTHALRAELEPQAARLGVHAALERQREGRSWLELPEHVRTAIERGGMAAVVDTFGTALAHLNEYRFRECQGALDSLPRNLPRSLRAEAEYLRAMCLASTRSEEDRDAAEAMLAGWRGFEEEEPEVAIRLMHMRLYCLTLVVDKAPGRALAAEIRQALSTRADYDQSALDAAYTLDRCAGSLHEPETALAQTREAVAHFGPAPGQTVLRRPVEFYRCLVNHGAKLVTNALYHQALEVYEQLEALVADYAPDTFPRLDYPRTNALLAEYRLGIVSAQDAVVRQRAIGAAHEVPGDPFYVENAIAVYLTLAGSGEEGLLILDRLDDQLSRKLRPEVSMRYLIRANRCATRYVTGNVDAAPNEWLALTETVHRIPYLIRKYLIPRHELLSEVMRRREATSPLAFDEAVLDETRYGPLWDQLGRGFRMPEVEWWR